MSDVLRGAWGLVLVGMLAASPAFGAPALIRDRTFADADWSVATFGMGDGGTVDATQVAAGNPAPARRVRTVVNDAPSPSDFSVVTGANLFTAAVYDPQAQGPFVDLDYSSAARRAALHLGPARNASSASP